MTINRARFDAARAAVMKARARVDGVRLALYAKNHHDTLAWYTRTDRAHIARAQAAYSKACDRMFDLLDSSPRHWRSGAPAYWVAETLSYEDAVRPRTETLSVVPPLSYGAVAPLQ